MICNSLVPIKTVQAQLLFFVELAFILMFRFQRKPTQLDELQRKETTSQWQRTQCSTEDKRRLVCGLYQRLLRVSTIFFSNHSRIQIIFILLTSFSPERKCFHNDTFSKFSSFPIVVVNLRFQ